MMAQSLRASRRGLVRLPLASSQALSLTTRRTFITPTAVRQADLVQDLYLRELKSYKPAPVKPTDSEGQVQKFAVPAAPQSPEESNLQSDLKSYETQQVEVEGQATGGAEPVEQDWFEEEPEEEGAKGH